MKFILTRTLPTTAGKAFLTLAPMSTRFVPTFATKWSTIMRAKFALVVVNTFKSVSFKPLFTHTCNAANSISTFGMG